MRAQAISLLSSLSSSILTSHYAPFLQRLTHIFTVPLCNHHGVSVSLPVIYSQHYTPNTFWAFKIFPRRCCMHYWSEGFLILLSRSRRGRNEQNPDQIQQEHLKCMKTECCLILDGYRSILHMGVYRLLGILFSLVKFHKKMGKWKRNKYLMKHLIALLWKRYKQRDFRRLKIYSFLDYQKACKLNTLFYWKFGECIEFQGRKKENKKCWTPHPLQPKYSSNSFPQNTYYSNKMYLIRCE